MQPSVCSVCQDASGRVARSWPAASALPAAVLPCLTTATAHSSGVWPICICRARADALGNNFRDFRNAQSQGDHGMCLHTHLVASTRLAAPQVNVNISNLLAISMFDNSGDPGPQAKGVKHLETPLRHLHITHRASSCAKRGGRVQLCSKARGTRGIEPEIFRSRGQLLSRPPTTGRKESRCLWCGHVLVETQFQMHRMHAPNACVNTTLPTINQYECESFMIIVIIIILISTSTKFAFTFTLTFCSGQAAHTHEGFRPPSGHLQATASPAMTPGECVQGNCSDPNAAAALGLSAAEAASMLPLKPRQCVVLVPDSFLMINGGPYWMDNLYLKLSRSRPHPSLAFIRGGLQYGLEYFLEVSSTSIYMTNITLQGELRGTAAGVHLEEAESSLFMQGADSAAAVLKACSTCAGGVMIGVMIGVAGARSAS